MKDIFNRYTIHDARTKQTNTDKHFITCMLLVTVKKSKFRVISLVRRVMLIQVLDTTYQPVDPI